MGSFASRALGSLICHVLRWFAPCEQDSGWHCAGMGPVLPLYRRRRLPGGGSRSATPVCPEESAPWTHTAHRQPPDEGSWVRLATTPPLPCTVGSLLGSPASGQPGAAERLPEMRAQHWRCRLSSRCGVRAGERAVSGGSPVPPLLLRPDHAPRGWVLGGGAGCLAQNSVTAGSRTQTTLRLVRGEICQLLLPFL